MGFVLVTIVGVIMGWLAVAMMGRDDRTSAVVCMGSGAAGGLIAALLSGDVPLRIGVSPTQLLWGVLGSALLIALVNAIASGPMRALPRKV